MFSPTVFWATWSLNPFGCKSFNLVCGISTFPNLWLLQIGKFLWSLSRKLTHLFHKYNFCNDFFSFAFQKKAKFQSWFLIMMWYHVSKRAFENLNQISASEYELVQGSESSESEQVRRVKRARPGLDGSILRKRSINIRFLHIRNLTSVPAVSGNFTWFKKNYLIAKNLYQFIAIL